jgi:hypothetical protein
MGNRPDFKKGDRLQYNRTVAYAGQFAGVVDRVVESDNGWRVYYSERSFNSASVLEPCKPNKKTDYPVYTISVCESINQLQYQVGCHLNAGYVLSGGVSFADGNYIQAMLKP